MPIRERSFSPPTVADGLLFEGDIYGNFNAFKYPTAPGSAVAMTMLPLRPQAGRRYRSPNIKLLHRIFPR